MRRANGGWTDSFEDNNLFHDAVPSAEFATEKRARLGDPPCRLWDAMRPAVTSHVFIPKALIHRSVVTAGRSKSVREDSENLTPLAGLLDQNNAAGEFKQNQSKLSE
jgi:hypothetical protein